MLHRRAAAFLYFLVILLEITNADIPVRVVPGRSFRLDLFPRTLGNANTCNLTNVQNISFTFSYDHKDNDTVIGAERTIQRLGNGHCGVRIFDANSKSDAGRFILSLSNGNQSINETFRVSFVPLPENQNRTTFAAIGTSRVPLRCGPESNMLYCEFRDPDGNLMPLTHRRRCQTQIDILSARHYGIWTCIVGLVGEPSEIFSTNYLRPQDDVEKIVIFSNKTKLGTFISWRVEGMVGTALWCRAFAPNGETILVLPGMENENFISVATDLRKQKCGLLINGEFAEKFYGTWRLEVGVNNRRAMGGFLRMPEGRVPNLADSLASRNESQLKEITELNVLPRTQFRINCQTNYSASYCWIGGPQGQQFTQSENITVGRCSQMVNNSDAVQHSGIWSCNMAHVDGGPEEQFLTKVNVIENHYQAVDSKVEAHLTLPAILKCRSVLEFPLEYCRFVRPDGKGIAVFPGQRFQDGHYRYFGSGLDFGDCGLRIEPIEKVDIGEWKCVTRTRSRMWEAEAWDTVNLQWKFTESTQMSGISPVVIILTTLIAIFIVLSLIMWFKVICHEEEYFIKR